MKDTEQLKKKLQEELATLEEELASTGRKNTEHSGGDWDAKPDQMDTLRADESEVADKIESYQENQAFVNQFEQRYHEVKDALARIEKGTYGTCKVCGIAIEHDRLVANPAATTCIKHKN